MTGRGRCKRLAGSVASYSRDLDLERLGILRRGARREKSAAEHAGEELASGHSGDRVFWANESSFENGGSGGGDLRWRPIWSAFRDPVRYDPAMFAKDRRWFASTTVSADGLASFAKAPRS